MRNARMEKWYAHEVEVTDDKGKMVKTTHYLPEPGEGTPAVWVAVHGKRNADK